MTTNAAPPDPPGAKTVAAGASSPLLQALQQQELTAAVVDLDHYRIGGGLAVETDYIIAVQQAQEAESGAGELVDEPADDAQKKTAPILEPFTLSKTYSSFRTLAHQLSNVAAKAKKSSSSHTRPEQQILQYCDLVQHLIESQRTEYVGKVNYLYVKMLAQQRSKIISDVLDATLSKSSCPLDHNESELIHDVARIIETFFLTDHVEGNDEEDEEGVRVVASKKKSHKKSNSGSSPLRWLKKVAGASSSEAKSTSSSTQKEREVSFESNKPPGSATASVVVPYTRRSRRPSKARAMEEEELNDAYGQDAGLLLDDARTQRDLTGGGRSATAMGTKQPRLPSYSRPVPVVRMLGMGRVVDNNPWLFVAIMGAVIAFLRNMAALTLTVDADLALWAVFAAFCLGLHTPRPLIGGFDRPATMKGMVRLSGASKRPMDRSGRQLLRRSIITTTAPGTPRSSIVSGAAGSVKEVSEDMTASIGGEASKEQIGVMEEEEEEVAFMDSPMAMFPKGAAIGSHNNCWSIPDCTTFQVRGPNYLVDKKKIPSGEFMFPCRGIDLFLTDTCPENVGSSSGVMGGRLRDVPTFIINFRLPWGVLLFYFEIPDRFVPFLRASYEEDFDKSQLEPLDDMSAGERAVCRYLLGDEEHKDNTIKIVPVVVDGPWVVRQVVSGKPALIGKKLPVSYVYQPAEDNTKDKKALYFEADLDIAASSAARGILSLCRTYTQILTVDLGFVIQGNSEDELPEQMLVGARLHGVDPLTAPSMPPMPTDQFDVNPAVSEDESV